MFFLKCNIKLKYLVFFNTETLKSQVFCLLSVGGCGSEATSANRLKAHTCEGHLHRAAGSQVLTQHHSGSGSEAS